MSLFVFACIFTLVGICMIPGLAIALIVSVFSEVSD